MWIKSVKSRWASALFSSRLSAVKYADKILFLQNGRVLGFDTLEKLIRTNADYRKMYNLQKEAYV
ncbi:ABC transporter ATP-binding protein [Lactobacillus helsingborgensis]|uniref:ABC transporter ATP-binding protein n=1 Tax=Lactobacillus helsingborgensis TaxID=1218494 RepID=UPI0016507A11|nr:ABC transporter ATP-binding protein [Lactobacillus helsingborgensis]